ncbi:MAG: ABC transporter ATP-binding protein [Spirochaetaceae bacterium]|nr:ABC transporter ATP-binding protein [Spirochaetaceae bacterium]
MLNITKTFPGIIANDNITIRVKDNEVHALLGENGAGKSTLMSILFGAYVADNGIIKIFGKEEKIKNPNIATNLGIGMVHQHFKLVHNYTVTENIVLGREPRNKFGILQIGIAEKKVQELSDKYGLMVDPKAKIDDISVGQQQRVEILKTLYSNSKIIIFDEPTAVLTPQEVDELMEIIRKLKKEGKTIILITHKLKEIKAVCDKCSVLRRGKYIDTVDVADVSENELASMMVGRPVKFDITKNPIKRGKVMLDVSHLTVKDHLHVEKVRDLTLQIHKGEILGIAGVDGNGQSELLMGLCGMLPVSSGTIILDGEDITHKTIKQRIEIGLGHVPEDRHKYGMIKEFTLSENAVLKDFYKPKYSTKYKTLNFPLFKEIATQEIEEFDIRTGLGADTVAGSLSGGNQQKAIVAREISLSPKVLLIAQPTRGLDVGAIEFIRKRILEERDKGQAILLVSFELDEIMNLCDRIAAISKGKIVGIFNDGEVNVREIGLMMASSEKNEGEKIEG